MSTPHTLPVELTIFTVGEWHPRMVEWLHAADEAGTGLDVDAGAVGEVDGAGVQLLLALDRALRDRGRALRLTGAGQATANACRQLGAQRLLATDTGATP